jgi:two-component system cell cycle sensor histidine kinase/response regulator CckA
MTPDAVLLVDDEESIRSTVRRVLSRAGYRVIVAADAGAAEAIWEAEAASIAVLLTDLELGGVDGAALAARFRAARPDLAVIVTSGYGADQVRAAHDLPPEARFLPKPFTTAELLEALRPLLPGR